MNQDQEQVSDQVKQDANTHLEMAIEPVISYNIDEDERPEGFRIRFKIRIVTGKHAAALDARQAEAIRELLLWTRTCRLREQRPLSR